MTTTITIKIVKMENKLMLSTFRFSFCTNEGTKSQISGELSTERHSDIPIYEYVTSTKSASP